MLIDWYAPILDRYKLHIYLRYWLTVQPWGYLPLGLRSLTTIKRQFIVMLL